MKIRNSYSCHFPKTILLDCDGVLLNWEQSFKKYCEHRLNKIISENAPKSWNMSSWIGVSENNVQNLIKDFNETCEDFEKIPALPDAKDCLLFLKEKQYTLHVITKSSRQKKSIDRRIKNLKQEFGEDLFTDIHCLNVQDSKKDILASYPKSFWIEDNPQNAKEGYDLGHTTFLFNAEHNQWARDTEKFPYPIPRIDTWKDLKNFFQSFQKNHQDT